MNTLPRRFYQLSLLSVSLLGLQGCILKLLDFATPTDGYHLTENVPYGELPRQSLDIYEPDSSATEPMTIVFFYGGAWQEGEKEQYRFVAQALAEMGYRVIIPDYRVYPDAMFPDFMDDAAKAVNWVFENKAQSVVLMGHSAGAHIAALLSFDKSYLKATDKIKAFVGLSGPYDFLPLKSDRLKIIFYAADDIQATQPINFVDEVAPPTLLIHGLEDDRVLPKNTQNLKRALHEKGNQVEAIYYPDGSHGMTVGAMAKPLRDQLPVLSDIENFLDSLTTNH